LRPLQGNIRQIICPIKTTREKNDRQEPKTLVMNKSLIILSIAVILINTVSGRIPTALADEPPAIPTGAEQTPWRIQADQLTYNHKTNVYTATGNVVIQKEDNTLRADDIRFDHSTMQAWAKGNIRLKAGEDFLTGDEMDLNLKTGIGSVSKGVLFMEKKHFYIRGDKIIKAGADRYAIHQGSFTSCDGPSPAWQITGKQLDVTLEGYGTAKNATMWAKNLPVLFIPYLRFPVKLKRQTGLLSPQFGTSDRKGAEFIQPFYWAINRSSDATFYAHYMQRRGVQYGGEYRYALSPESRGALMFNSLHDRQKDDGTEDSSRDWGYGGDNVLRPNSDRYWFRMKLDQEMPADFDLKLDLDVVSDQDYLREFSDGYTGYDDTKAYFESEFGRDIDDDNDPVRENRLNINRNWTSYSLNADLVWYDNVINRRQHETDTTLQQVPQITFYALKQPLLDGPVYLNLDSEYTYFYGKDTDTTKTNQLTGQRSTLYPRIYLPYRCKNFFTLEPSAGFRQTLWYSHHEGDEPAESSRYQHREIYDLQLDLTADIFKVFSVNGQSIDKIKHTLIPKLQYTYIPGMDQSEYPDYDDTDRIGPQNMLTFSITNLLVSKHQPQKIGDTPVSAAYNQFCRFLVEQSYDFNRRDAPDQTPFHPLYAELDITPVKHVSLEADAEWNHHHGRWDSRNLYCRLRDMRGDRISLEHRYTHDESHSIQIDFMVVLTHRISVYGGFERNLDDDEEIEKSLGLLYQAQCWSIDVYMEDKEDDKKAGFMINLYGLGGRGNRL
jgi:LPS-assembly protein